MADNVLRRDVNKGNIVPKGRCLAKQQSDEGNGVGPIYGVKLLSAMRAGGMIRDVVSGKWTVTELQEAIGEFNS